MTEQTSRAEDLLYGQDMAPVVRLVGTALTQAEKARGLVNDLLNKCRDADLATPGLEGRVDSDRTKWLDEMFARVVALEELAKVTFSDFAEQALVQEREFRAKFDSLEPVPAEEEGMGTEGRRF